MACRCGHKMPDQPIITSEKVKFGEYGLTLVKYIGYYDEVTHVGAVTGRIYRFGLEFPERYVDSRDAAHFQDMQEDGLKAFRVIV